MNQPLRLLLVRHGTTKANQEKRFLGRLDLPLNEQGEGEVKGLAARLKNEKIAHVISSPLLRARQTASVIATQHNLPVTIDERLVELDYGSWDGLTWQEVGTLDLAGRQAWLQDGVSVAPHGGETMADVAARVSTALQEWRATINPEAGAVVAVFHGAALAAALCTLLDTPLRGLWPYRAATASLSEIQWFDIGPVLTKLNT
ncbi:MAG: histidine phosphatase family protein [Ardenticatenaceae bacterium]